MLGVKDTGLSRTYVCKRDDSDLVIPVPGYNIQQYGQGWFLNEPRGMTKVAKDAMLPQRQQPTQLATASYVQCDVCDKSRRITKGLFDRYQPEGDLQYCGFSCDYLQGCSCEDEDDYQRESAPIRKLTQDTDDKLVEEVQEADGVFL